MGTVKTLFSILVRFGKTTMVTSELTMTSGETSEYRLNPCHWSPFYLYHLHVYTLCINNYLFINLPTFHVLSSSSPTRPMKPLSIKSFVTSPTMYYLRKFNRSISLILYSQGRSPGSITYGRKSPVFYGVYSRGIDKSTSFY